MFRDESSMSIKLVYENSRKGSAVSGSPKRACRQWSTGFLKTPGLLSSCSRTVQMSAGVSSRGVRRGTRDTEEEKPPGPWTAAARSGT
jgi:hypothetical protein